MDNFSRIKQSIPEVVRLKAIIDSIYKEIGHQNLTGMLYAAYIPSNIRSDGFLHIDEIHESRNTESGDTSSDLFMIEMLEDFIWEQLNTGHWKDVPGYWRKFYAFVVLVKVIFLSKQNSTKPQYLINLCDMGLLVGDPHVGSTLAAIATCLHNTDVEQIDGNDCSESNLPLPEPSLIVLPGTKLEIVSLEKPSLEYFRVNHFQPEVPVVITNAIEHWPASKTWNPTYICKMYGSRTVPIELGSKYTADDWTQKLMTIEDFVANYMRGGRNSSCDNSEPQIGYLAQHTLFDQIPEMRADIQIPDYCFLGDSEDVEINAWFGPASTVTPTHYDPKHNLLVQVFGYKVVRLFPPSESVYLSPHAQDSLLFNTSQVDMEDPLVLSKYPAMANVTFADVVLIPGSVLYMPPRWWHFVKSLSPSFSVSFWFQ